MKKKTIWKLLTVTAVLSAAACGGEDTSVVEAPGRQSTSSQTEASQAGAQAGSQSGKTGEQTGSQTGGQTEETGGQAGQTGGQTGQTGGQTEETGESGGQTGETGGQTGETGGQTGETGGQTGETGETGGGAPAPFVPKDGEHKVIFLHHSTGQIVWNGQVEGEYKKLRPKDTISEKMYPTYNSHVTGALNNTPWSNRPQDYEYLWGIGTPANPGDRNKTGQADLDTLVSEADIIVVKHCFDEGDMDADEPAGAHSFKRTLTNYKRSYERLRPALIAAKYKDVKFIFWTIPPREKPQANNQDVKAFQKWVVGQWDKPGDNIFVFDYRALVTRGVNGQMIAEYVNADGHPTPALGKLVAPCFARRVADVANGDGDKGGAHALTGGCDPAQFGLAP